MQEFPQAEVTDIALEFGTVPPDAVLSALRADQWLYRTPGADPETRERIKEAVLSAFFVDRDEWKSAIVDQGIITARQAVTGLSAA